METGYQRGRIQDESMLYEQRKHDGSLPIIGVNTFLRPRARQPRHGRCELARGTEEEKRVPAAAAGATSTTGTPRERPPALRPAARRPPRTGRQRLRRAHGRRRACCSLGQITDALFEVGGQYRRNV